MHVGDDGASRLEPVDPRQRVIDAEVAGMCGVAQPINNPEIEIFEMRPALARNVADIWRIGGIGDAITERRYVAVLEKKRRERKRTALPFDGAAFAGLDSVMVQDRRIVAARRRHEAV